MSKGIVHNHGYSKLAEVQLWGVHWYSEGDVKYVVSSKGLRDASEKFLLAEYNLISEEMPDQVIKHHIKYDNDGVGWITIKVGEDIEIKGKVEQIRFQRIKTPKLVCDLVHSTNSSIQPVAVTQLDKATDSGCGIEIYLSELRPEHEFPDLT